MNTAASKNDRITLKRRFFLRFFAVAGIPLVLLGSVFVVLNARTERKVVLDAQQQLVDATNSSYDFLFRSFLLNTSVFSYMPEIRTLYEQVNPEDENARLAVQEALRRLIRQFDEAVDAVLFLSDYGYVLRQEGRTSLASYSLLDPTVAEILEQRGLIQSLWVPQHQATIDQRIQDVISFVMPIPFEESRAQGVLVVHFSVPRLLLLCRTCNTSGGTMFLLDRERRVLFGSGDYGYLETLRKQLPDQLIRRPATLEKTMVGGLSRYVDTSESNVADWIYVHMIRRPDTREWLANRAHSFGVWLTILLGLGGLAAWVLAHRSVRPVQRLLEAVERIDPDNASELGTLPELQKAVMNILDNWEQRVQKTAEMRSHWDSLRLAFLIEHEDLPADVSFGLNGIDEEKRYRAVVLANKFKRLDEYVESCFDSTLRVFHLSHLVAHDSGRMVYVLGDTETSLVEPRVVSMLETAFDSVEPHLREGVHVYVGPPVSEVTQVRRSYLVTQELEAFHHLFESEQVIVPGMLPEPGDQPPRYPEKAVGKFLDSLAGESKDAVENRLDAVLGHFDDLAAHRPENQMVQMLKFFVHDLLMYALHEGVPLSASVRSELSEMLESLAAYSNEAHTRIRSVVNEIVHNTDAKRGRDGILTESIRYINEHYRTDIPLDDLAAISGITPQYFSTLFKQHTGKNFTTYVAELRMLDAARLLRETDTPVQEIAAIVGYSSAQYFIRVFKGHFGVSPLSYRKGRGTQEMS